MTHHAHEEEIAEEVADQIDERRTRNPPGFLKRLIISLLINIGAVVIVMKIVKGIHFADDIDTLRLQIRTLVIAGTLMGLGNGILKPILKFFTFPLIILTLGLTLLVINMAVFWLVVSNVPGLIITGGIATYFWGSVIFSIVNTIEHWIFKILHKL